jgi:sodium/proline symporter
MNQLIALPIYLYLFYIIILTYKEYRSRKRYGSTYTPRQEALGTHTYGFIVVAMTLIGSNLGPADTMGLSEQGAKYGFFFLLFPVCAGLQQILAGRFFATKIAIPETNCITMADRFGDKINPATRVVIGIVTVLQALAFTGILALAGGQILSSSFGMPLTAGILFTAIFVALYTHIGGMNSVIETDVFQTIIIYTVAFIALIASTFLMLSNWSSVPTDWFWKTEGGDFSFRNCISLAVAYFLGEAFLPMYTIRAFVSKKPKDASRAFIVFGSAIILYYAIMIFVGISSNLLIGQNSISDIALVNVMASITTIPWIRSIMAGLAFAGLLGLTHSTLDSVLNAGASSLVIDIVKPIAKIPDNQVRKHIGNSLMLIAIFGTLFSLVSNSLIDILMIGYAVWVPTVVFPFAYVLLYGDKIKTNKSVLIGIIGGCIGYVLGEKLLTDIWIPSILLGFLSNALFFLVNERLSSRQEIKG